MQFSPGSAARTHCNNSQAFHRFSWLTYQKLRFGAILDSQGAINTLIRGVEVPRTVSLPRGNSLQKEGTLVGACEEGAGRGGLFQRRTLVLFPRLLLFFFLLLLLVLFILVPLGIPAKKSGSLHEIRRNLPKSPGISRSPEACTRPPSDNPSSHILLISRLLLLLLLLIIIIIITISIINVIPPAPPRASSPPFVKMQLLYGATYVADVICRVIP
eukprot:9470945-Pyramimonas_sp.AAC.1